jgi:hypothetical protein
MESGTSRLFIFFVYAVTAAAATILFEFQTPGRCFLIFCRHVVALFAFSTLQNYIIAWHKILPRYLINNIAYRACTDGTSAFTNSKP